MVRLQKIKQNLETQPIQEPQIINCRISKGKLITQLDDGREIITPVNLLTKWEIIDSNVKPEQLKNYKIIGEGNLIHFLDIDEVLPTRKIIKGLHTC